MSTESFDPSNINSFILYNENYNVIPVKIRLKDASDPGTISFGPGQTLTFEVQYSSGKAKFYYTGKEVQMIDLNDGGSSDDFNTPNSDYNSFNSLRYNPGNFQGSSDVISFDNNTYETRFTDDNGIDGGDKATFNQTIVGTAIKASITH